MAALQCEICGGKLIGKPGGVFECEYCGMEYSTAWAKAKIQEIKGTVKVEGTVEVKGTVKLDGPVEVKGNANLEGLLKRGWMAIEDRQFDEAEKCFNQALKLEPECGQAYFGIAMATDEASDVAGLAEASDFGFKKYIDRARKYPDDKVRAMLREYDGLRAEKQRKEQERIQQETLKKQQKEAARQKSIEQGPRELPKLRAKLVPFQKRIALCNFELAAIGKFGQLLYLGYESVEAELKYHPDWCNRRFRALTNSGSEFCGVRTDGMLSGKGLSLDFKYLHGITDLDAGDFHMAAADRDGYAFADGSNYRECCNVGRWREIRAVACGSGFTAGLHYDGTVVSTHEKHTAVKNWTEIVAIAAHGDILAGLRVDGTVVTIGGSREVLQWTDVVAISVGGHCIVGLTKDGTALHAASDSAYGGKRWILSKWTDLVAIQAGEYEIAAIRRDGTVLYTKDADYRKAPEAVKGWKLFDSMDDIQPLDIEEVIPETPEITKKRKRKLLEARRGAVVSELANLKGLFTGKRRKELEERLASIDRQLKGLNGYGSAEM